MGRLARRPADAARAAGVLALAGIVACSIVAPLDGLNGGRVADASAPAADTTERAADVDAGNAASAAMNAGGSDGDAAEAGAVDASSRLDASADASGDGDAAGAASDGASGGPCDGSSAIVCEDFENGIDQTFWQVQAAGGTLALEQAPSPVHSGSWSLHVHIDPVTDASAAPSTEALLSHTASYPAGVHTRTFVYGALPEVAANFAIYQHLGPDVYSGMALYYGNPVFGWTSWPNPPNPPGMNDLDAWPGAGAWHCVEWAFDTGSAGTVQVWLDGAEQSSLDVADAILPQSFVQASFGLALSQASATDAIDLWFDDIVIGTQLIGCGP
jgi:hypothetical protein